MINQPPQQNAPVMGQQDEEKKKRQGTGFANINRILQANQGAGQRIGQTIGSNLSKQAEDVRKGIESSKQQFQAGQGAAVAQAGEKIGQAQRAVRGANETEQDYLARIAKPEEPIDFTQVGQNLRQAQYTGPKGLENESILKNRAENTQQLTNLAGQGAAGQDALLRNMVAGRGGYTRGQSALDRLLLSREGNTDLQRGRQAGVGLIGETQTQANIAQQKAQAAGQEIEAQKKSILDTVRKTLGGVEGSEGILERAAKATMQRNQDAKRLQELMTKEARDLEMTEDDLQVLERLRNTGLDKEIFTGDGALSQTTLNNLASSLVTDQNAKLFRGDEQGAAANLAKLLGDQQVASDIEKNKYDEDVLKELDSQFDPSRQAAQTAQNQLALNQRNVGIAQDLQNRANAVLRASGGNISRIGDINSIFEPLEQIMPGIRSRVDNDPYSILGLDWRQFGGQNSRFLKDFQKAAYLKLASDPGTLQNMINQQQQQEQFIKSNTKSIFDALKEKVSSKLPKKETK